MIVPCQRISKHKHFMLREIVRPKGQLWAWISNNNNNNNKKRNRVCLVGY
jgi:hypothetical protein